MSGVPRLDAARLEALDADEWAWFLPLVRGVLGEYRDELDTDDAALVDLPAGRLAGGRPRRRVAKLVTREPRILAALAAAVADAPDAPATIAALLSTPELPGADDEETDQDPTPTFPDRDRMRRLRDQLEVARRQAQGAQARADAFERRLVGVTEDLERARVRLAEVLAELDEAGRERDRAVERERRRREQEIARLRTEVRRLRQSAAEARRAVKPSREARPTPPTAVRDVDREEFGRVTPGRPTVLPDGVQPLSREAAELLMNRGRLVVVDGYNVTLQHQASLPLEQQRRWLIGLAASAARRFGARPLIVFDGEVAGPGDAAAFRQGVRVRFTESGFTADDDIVLEVEATDEPVVVVTDDAELGRRVRAADGDVLATGPFVWATR